MKYEQKVQVEMSEYICFVKRIDGVVAQKTLEEELTRCKDRKYWRADGYNNGCKYMQYIVCENDYCSNAERKDNDH